MLCDQERPGGGLGGGRGGRVLGVGWLVGCLGNDGCHWLCRGNKKELILLPEFAQQRSVSLGEKVFF